MSGDKSLRRVVNGKEMENEEGNPEDEKKR